MPGGFQRDWWWVIGGRKKLLRDGTPGTAVIKNFEFMVGDGEASQADMTLEVRVDGREPYELQGCFSYDGAAAAGRRAGTNLAGMTAPGSLVAVRVHPRKRKRVAIDWEHSPATVV